jgi:hypothetical protein
VADIFICYRHEDASGHAGRLAETLSDLFPHSHIFRDVEGLEPGSDFTKVIAQNLDSCAAFLAVIGPRWLDEGADGRARIHDADDFVRLEIATALGRGTFLIPVLVGGAEMPSAGQLPEEIKPLAHLQAHEITERRWDADVGALVRVLARQPGLRSLRRTLAALRPRFGWKLVFGAAIASIAALVLATKLTEREEPVLPAGLSLLDVDLVAGDPAGNCIKPSDCNAQDGRAMSEVIQLGDTEIRYDPANRQMHLLLSIRWTLREGQSRYFHRGYTGKFYYTVGYEVAQPSGSVMLGGLTRQAYSMAPINGLIAFAFGWTEIPFLAARDNDLAAEIRRRLNESEALQALR